MDVSDFMRVNADRILEVVDGAEVLAVGFSLFPERLLIDFRHNEQEPPLIQVAQPVNSAEERLKELAKLRPAFTNPEHFYFFMWPRSVDSFVELSVWERITARCEASGHPEVAEACQAALARLRELEREEKLQAIGGPKYRTVWQRK